MKDYWQRILAKDIQILSRPISLKSKDDTIFQIQFSSSMLYNIRLDMAQLRGREWLEWQNNVGYDKNWAEADPVTLLPRPSIQACLSLFHFSYKGEQEWAGERNLEEGKRWMIMDVGFGGE